MYNSIIVLVFSNTILPILKKDKNPFSNEDGTPREGFEPQFFAWAREKEIERRKALPEDVVKAIEESEQALAKRMDS